MKTENLNETIEKIGEQVRTLTPPDNPQDVPSRFKLAEDKFYELLVAAQQKLEHSIADNEADPSDTRALSGVAKDVMTGYGDAVRARKLAEVEIGKVVPISVLGTYNKKVMPAIATAIDNLRLDILNGLQPAVRAEFERCWKSAYVKFGKSVQEAALSLQKIVEEAQMDAAGKNPSRVAERKSQSAKQRYAAKRLDIK